MCTKNLCPIFMLTYFTNLLFGSFDAAILFSWCNQEVNVSGHVTIYTKHATWHIYPLLFQYLLDAALIHHSVTFLEPYN